MNLIYISPVCMGNEVLLLCKIKCCFNSLTNQSTDSLKLANRMLQLFRDNESGARWFLVSHVYNLRVTPLRDKCVKHGTINPTYIIFKTVYFILTFRFMF